MAKSSEHEGGDFEKSGPGAKVNKPACAYAVMDGGKVPEPLTMPGDLYFYRPEGYVGNVPKEQEAAKEKIEDFWSYMRLVLEISYSQYFSMYFTRTLSTAQSVFDPQGFRPESLGDLTRYSREIQQLIGGQIKADYIQKLVKATIIACVVIIIGTLVVYLISYALDLRKIIVPVQQAAQAAQGKAEAGQKVEVPNVARWEKGYSIVHMGVLLICGMWGLFISASSRNFTPTFDKLATPEADLMPPWSRLLFFGILILALASILVKRIVTVSIGDMFSTADINQDLMTAGLIGLFLGISERALPKELESWAGSFFARIQNARETSS